MSNFVELDHPLDPTFPQEEYKSRIKRLQTAMGKQGLDLLMLTSIDNIIYTTGYRSWYFSSRFRPVICMVPQTGEPVVIVRLLEKYTVEYTSWVRNIWCWGSKRSYAKELMADSLLDICAKAITELGSPRAVVGIEAGEGLRFNAPLIFLEELKMKMTGVKFTDGSQAIQTTRMIKSPFEVDLIRQACRITEQAIKKAIFQIKPGMSEETISSIVASEMAAAGIDRISYLTVISGREKYPTFNAYSTNRKVEKGDIVLFDISGHYKGYASDLTRCAYVGKAPENFKKMAEVSCQSVQAGIQKAQPGVPLSEVNRAAEEVIINSGYQDYLLHSSGHGIGLEVVEYPFIDSQQNCVVEPGMVFAIEQGIYPYDLGKGVSTISSCFRSEDIIYVTSLGPELLSGPDQGLVEIEI
jgi:Xaa-Pro aminopeptidase